jgi:hypothetical protein
MFRWLQLLLLFLIVCSCSSGTKKGIPINFDVKESILLSDLGFSYTPVSIKLPDTVFFGQVERIAADDDYYFIHDPNHSQTVTIIDKEGNFVSQLKRLGGDEGEYSSLYAFAIDKWNKHLVVYDRNKKQILEYSYPDLHFQHAKPLNLYLTHLELIDPDHFLVVCDDESGKNVLRGMEIWSRDYEVIKTGLIDQNYSVVETTYPSSFGTDGRSLLYVHPLNGKVYRISADEIVEINELDLGFHTVPIDLYGFNNANDFEERIQRRNYAFWFRRPIIRGDSLFLWFSFGSVDNEHIILVNLLDKSNQIFKSLSADNLPLLSIPSGFESNGSVFFLFEIGQV